MSFRVMDSSETICIVLTTRFNIMILQWPLGDIAGEVFIYLQSYI